MAQKLARGKAAAHSRSRAALCPEASDTAASQGMNTPHNTAHPAVRIFSAYLDHLDDISKERRRDVSSAVGRL